MDTDIFSQETKVLADFKKIKEDGTSSQSDFDRLVGSIWKASKNNQENN